MELDNAEKLAVMEQALKLAKLSLDNHDFERAYKHIDRAKAVKATIVLPLDDF